MSKHRAFEQGIDGDTLAMFDTAKIQAESWSDPILWLGHGQGGGYRSRTKLKIVQPNLVHPYGSFLSQSSPGRFFLVVRVQLVSLWRFIQGANPGGILLS